MPKLGEGHHDDQRDGAKRCLSPKVSIWPLANMPTATNILILVVKYSRHQNTQLDNPLQKHTVYKHVSPPKNSKTSTTMHTDCIT